MAKEYLGTKLKDTTEKACRKRNKITGLAAGVLLALSLNNSGCMHTAPYTAYGAYTGAKEAYVAANSNVFLNSMAAVGGAVAGAAIKGGEGLMNDALFLAVDRKFRYDGLTKPIGAFGNGSSDGGDSYFQSMPESSEESYDAPSEQIVGSSAAYESF